MIVTKSDSFFLWKKILSLYCSPTNNENWLATAAQTDDGGSKKRKKAKIGKQLSQIFERFLVQPMPPHLSVERLVVDLRLFGSQGNCTFVLDQQASQIVSFAALQPLL